MKKILKISITALATVGLLGSCIKETMPTDVATKDQVSKSPTALKAMVSGIPAALVMANSTKYAERGQAWDFALPAIHIALESMTGDLVIPGVTGYDWFGQWGTNQNLGSDYAIGALTWDNYYIWVKAANDLISTIDPAALTPETKSYLGFAYTYRAMCYLDLVRLYEFKENKYTSGPDVVGLGVPIVTETTTEADAKANPRATVVDVYNKVIFPDLTKAAELLSDYVSPDKYTLSLAYVYGLMARAYLERGTAGDSGAYASAAEYARKAITASGCTPLTQAQWEDPKTGFNSATSNNAWIWGLALPSESVANLYNYTAHMSTEESWTSYGWAVCRAINKSLYQTIDDKDFRKRSWLDPDRSVYAYKSCRPDGTQYFAEKLKDYGNIKFRPAQGAYSDYKVGGAADHVCMRVEEMYFIEAEAAAHASLADGISKLNDFMKLRITDGSYDCTDKAANIAAFTQELMLQKRVEFWGEGISLFDMKRLGISSERGYKGTNSPADYRLNCDGVAPYWTFVITRSETMNNPAVTAFNNPDPSEMVPLWVDK